MLSPKSLKRRAELLAHARHFFSSRGILEVDTPLLMRGAPLDSYIDPFPVANEEETLYLHTSPEYGMKRLLAHGAPDIYQLSHVYRRGEAGSRHNPEFMMLEWYRLDISFAQMISETVQFLIHMLGKAPVIEMTYREAFQAYAGLSFETLSHEKLSSLLPLSDQARSSSLEELIPLAFAELVEAKFPSNSYCIIKDFPVEQAALAKVEQGVAKRFEVYFKGYELANGYQELQDHQEQRKRFEKVQKTKNLPLDEQFLLALKQGLPACCGVAVGFERLVMLALEEADIRKILPISWEEL